MKKKKLGEILLDAGSITRAQLADALQDQKRYGGKLGDILLDRRYIDEKEFFRALTKQLRIPAFDFSQSTVPENVIKMVPQDTLEKHNVFPVALKQTPKGRVLVLAMADPTNVNILDEIRFTTGCKVEPALALESTLRYVIRDYFFDLLGQGSYRMEGEAKFDQADDAQRAGALTDESSTSLVNDERFEIQHERRIDQEPLDEPAENNKVATANASPERPQLTRELKTLLKILAKKGIISPKEYLEEFNETE